MHPVPEIFYDEFSLVVDKADIPRLHTILAAIGPAQRRRLRAGLLKNHRYFVWDRPYGRAYNLTLLELCIRAKTILAARREVSRARALLCPHPKPASSLPPQPAAGAITSPPTAAAASAHVSAGYHPSAEMAAEANFERYPAVLEASGASGGAALRHVEQAPAGRAAATSAKPGKRRVPDHQTKRTAPNLNAPDEAALRVHCSADCSAHEALFAGIDVDLSLWPTGIDKRTTDAALRRWRENGVLCSIMILNGTLYKMRTRYADGKRVEHSDPPLQAMLREVYDLVNEQREAGTPLPDVELLINADDYGFSNLRDRPVLPLLSITKKRGLGADILYPTGHYVEWARNQGGKLVGLHSEAYRYPWRRKREVALFRGRPNTHTSSRYALPRMVNGSKQIDMGLVWYNAAHDHLRRATPSLAPLALVEEVPMERHAEYKYLISLDGNSYSHRLLKLLAINSVVVKEETPYVEFYYHLLRPHVHYVPFVFAMERRQLATARSNLTEVVRAAIKNDDAMRGIAERGHALAHTHLCYAARRCYLLELLRRYGRKMAYTPSLADRPAAVRITHPRQLWRADDV